MEKYLAKIENHIFNNQNSKVRMFLFVEKPNVGSKLVCNDQLISYPNASEKDMLIICPYQTLLTSFHQLTFLPSLSYTTSDNMLL